MKPNERMTKNPLQPEKQRAEEGSVKIKSSVISPPEPTPQPKDYDSIEY